MDNFYCLTNQFDESVALSIRYHDGKPYIVMLTEEQFQSCQVFLNVQEAQVLAEKLLEFAGIVKGAEK